jgi:hypothetical protein
VEINHERLAELACQQRTKYEVCFDASCLRHAPRLASSQDNCIHVGDVYVNSDSLQSFNIHWD